MRFRLLLPIALLLVASCSHDSTGPSDPLVGNWEADPRCLWDCWFTIRSVADPTDSLNLTNQLSARFELDISSNGTYQVQLSAPSVATYQDHGTYQADGALLILSGPDGVDTLEYQLASPLLHLSFRNRLDSFDLNGDGVQDTASVAATLKKF